MGTGREAMGRLRRHLFLDLAPRPILLAGTGRSGTTWLGELLNFRGDHRVMWEPFNAEQVAAARALGDRPYLRPDNDCPRRLAAAGRILAGRARDPWVESFNSRWVYRRRLVKDIRTNLMLGWLTRHWPDMPVIFLLRHPGAVIDSWLRQPWRQRLSVAPMLAQPELVEDHLQPYRHLLQPTADLYTDALFAWCVENLVPLRQLEPGRALIVFYEELVRHSQEQLARIMAYIGQPLDPRMLEGVHKPSALTGDRPKGDPALSWLDRAGPARLREIHQALHAFSLGHLYGDTPDPRVNADDVLQWSSPTAAPTSIAA